MTAFGDLLAEVVLDLLGDGLGELVPVVDHREEDLGDVEPRVDPSPYDVDRLEELAQAFQGVELALHRHEDAVAGGKDVDRKQAKGGRRVEDDPVVVFLDGFEGVAEDELLANGAQEDRLGPGEVERGGDEVEAGGDLDDRLVDGGRGVGAVYGVDEDLVEGRLGLRPCPPRGRWWRCPAGRSRRGGRAGRAGPARRRG